MVSIIIPTHNHLEDCLRPCIESIIQYTDLSDVEVIVVANGCTDSTREYVMSLGSPFTLLWHDQGLGYTRATNYGIQAARGDYIVLLNNDTVLLGQPKHAWIQQLRAPFDTNPATGITGPHYLVDPNTQTEFLVFFCVMLSRQLVNALGLLDEVFSPGGGEDTDYCIRARQHGFKVVPTGISVPAPGTNLFNTGPFPIWHKGEATFNHYPQWQEIFDRNSELLRRRKMEGYYS